MNDSVLPKNVRHDTAVLRGSERFGVCGPNQITERVKANNRAYNAEDKRQAAADRRGKGCIRQDEKQKQPAKRDAEARFDAGALVFKQALRLLLRFALRPVVPFAGGEPFPREQLVDGRAEQLRERGQHRDIRQAVAGFPFAYCFSGKPEPPGNSCCV